MCRCLLGLVESDERRILPAGKRPFCKHKEESRRILEDMTEVVRLDYRMLRAVQVALTSLAASLDGCGRSLLVPADFEKAAGSVLRYVAQYAPRETAEFLLANEKNIEIRYMDYDWRLNDVKNRPPEERGAPE